MISRMAFVSHLTASVFCSDGNLVLYLLRVQKYDFRDATVCRLYSPLRPSLLPCVLAILAAYMAFSTAYLLGQGPTLCYIRQTFLHEYFIKG